MTATATLDRRRPHGHGKPPGCGLIRPRPDADPDLIDEVAIEVVLAGLRRVRLTRNERIEAARRILDDGGTVANIRHQLGISAKVCDSLLAEARLTGRIPPLSG